MIKLAVAGACGKMGKRIIALAKENKNLKVVFGLEFVGHPDIGKIIDGVKITADCQEIKNCDCLIDFTSPQATIEHLEYLVRFKKCGVLGATGLDDAAQAKIAVAAKKIPIVFSPNMSVGVNLLFRLVKLAATILQNYNVQIEEAHHIHKKDSPSGTAKKIAQIINLQGYNIKFEDIKAIREGEIVGDHKVVFESLAESLTLSHHAKTRDMFAQGALRAASWLKGKKKGFYNMEDILFPKPKGKK